jgi:hypothetical protein
VTYAELDGRFGAHSALSAHLLHTQSAPTEASNPTLGEIRRVAYKMPSFLQNHCVLYKAKSALSVARGYRAGREFSSS